MNPAPNFDGLAPIYRWLELASFGNALWRCRCHFLDELRECRRALVLGDGDGRFTARLLETNREVHIDAVDASEAMLRALLDRSRKHGGRLRTFCADVRTWEPAGQSYDLVVSHFFLDCLTTEEVAELARRLRPRLAPQARWLVSEFAEPKNRFGRMVARPVVRGLYLAFRGLTGLRVRRLPEYTKALTEEGLRGRRKREFLGGLLVTELWSAEQDKLLQSC